MSVIKHAINKRHCAGLLILLCLLLSHFNFKSEIPEMPNPRKNLKGPKNMF